MFGPCITSDTVLRLIFFPLLYRHPQITCLLLIVLLQGSAADLQEHAANSGRPFLAHILHCSFCSIWYVRPEVGNFLFLIPSLVTFSMESRGKNTLFSVDH